MHCKRENQAGIREISRRFQSAAIAHLAMVAVICQHRLGADRAYDHQNFTAAALQFAICTVTMRSAMAFPPSPSSEIDFDGE